MPPDPTEGASPGGTPPSDYVAEQSFDDLALSPELRRGIAEKGYRRPTPVQAATFADVVAGHDLIVRSKTGTGKTAAFGIPLLERIPADAGGVRAIILCPTRELALQVADEISALGKHKGSKVVPIYGGAPMKTQVDALRAGGEIVVGTPGRVYDHIRRGTLDLSHAMAGVLDEADEMLSMGFFEEVTRILDHLPKDRQTLLFSATVPPDIQQIIQKYLREPKTILLSGDEFTVEGIENVIYYGVDAYPKPRNLLYLVELEEPENAIVFCNTRDDTTLVAAVLNRNGYDADLLNGDLPQKERERVMQKVKAGEVRFMVATDIAARGIDISDLTHVINYSLPEDPAVYLHRVGRTGRIGKKGTAISIVSGRELVTLTALEKRFGIHFEERKLPTPEAARKLWTDRHVATLREGASGAIFEAFIPLAQTLRERPDGDYLVAFALKYFFHHRQKELALQRTGPAAPAESATPSERPQREERPRREERSRRDERSHGDGERRSGRGKPEERERPPREDRTPSDQKRLYVVLGESPFDAKAYASALAGPLGLSAETLAAGFEPHGRGSRIALPLADADRLLGLDGQELLGQRLRVEVARSAPPRRRRH